VLIETASDDRIAEIVYHCTVTADNTNVHAS